MENQTARVSMSSGSTMRSLGPEVARQSEVDWRNGQPVSLRFGDVYFSQASGIDETRFVFLAQNRLAERFVQVPPGGSFVVVETGFGTGLNFLCTWELWMRTAPSTARLHFVSTELYPLTRDEIARALALWPALGSSREALLAAYGPRAPGWDRRSFEGGRIVLTLLDGDVRETLPELQGLAEAWFLDGFSPARNPQMWEGALCQCVASRSRPGCTFATYTSAGSVRRALASAGFRVEKIKGFGPKREMLRGELIAQRSEQAPKQNRRQAIVIGGGLAGTAAASSLARRGWKVVLIERREGLAMQASGNPQGVLYARLSPHPIPLSQLILAGYRYTLGVLRERLPCDGVQWSDCGILQIAFDENEAKRLEGLAALGWPSDLMHGVSPAQASELSGIPLSRGGLFFPGGGWVNSPALCRALAAEPGVDVHTQRHALRLERSSTRWRVYEQSECIAESAVVIVAGASSSTVFDQLAHLPLRTVRGQVTLLPATAESERLTTVLCGESYAAPARSGTHTAGATFARDASVDEATAADNAENLRQLGRLADSLYAALGGAALDAGRLTGRAGQRCTSPDYLPMIGPVTDTEGQSLPGLYVSTAHGSRGLVTAPLGGEILAAYLEDEPAPLPKSLMEALLPGRFQARAARRSGAGR
jgi:tRNA 5-methylaminomethyl-2-thiouridine biosynthesis bifunctional protein